MDDKFISDAKESFENYCNRLVKKDIEVFKTYEKVFVNSFIRETLKEVKQKNLDKNFNYNDIRSIISRKIDECKKRTESQKYPDLARELTGLMNHYSTQIVDYCLENYNKNKQNNTVESHAKLTFGYYGSSAQAPVPDNQKRPSKPEEKEQQKIEATLLMKFINYVSEIFACFKGRKQDNNKIMVHTGKIQGSKDSMLFYGNPTYGNPTPNQKGAVVNNYILSINR